MPNLVSPDMLLVFDLGMKNYEDRERETMHDYCVLGLFFFLQILYFDFQLFVV